MENFGIHQEAVQPQKRPQGTPVQLEEGKVKELVMQVRYLALCIYKTFLLM
jgi:hypothetical protein